MICSLVSRSNVLFALLSAILGAGVVLALTTWAPSSPLRNMSATYMEGTSSVAFWFGAPLAKFGANSGPIEQIALSISVTVLSTYTLAMLRKLYHARPSRATVR